MRDGAVIDKEMCDVGEKLTARSVDKIDGLGACVCVLWKTS